MDLTVETGLKVAEGLGIALTHPERPALASGGPAKAQLAAYYHAVGERMLPHLANRPLSLLRQPHDGHPFLQKHAAGGLPDSIGRIAIAEKEGDTEDYIYVSDLGGILSVVQLNGLEFHIWGSHVETLEQPDRIVFDIDPDEGLDFRDVRAAALHIRQVLGEWGLASFPMATGGKGIHVIAPLRPVTEWPLISLFCRTFAQRLERSEPLRYTTNIRKAERKGRVFVDYLRNTRGATAIAPFSTRARQGLSCAVPLAWDEVDALKSASSFDIGAAAARAADADPWSGYFALTQSVTRGMVEAVAGPLKGKD